MQTGILPPDERPLDNGRLRNKPENERRNPSAERAVERGVEMKKVYTEIELDNLIRKYGFENKRVIAYAKRLDKQEKV